MDLTVDGRPSLAQLAQRIGAEGREHQHPLGAEDTPYLREKRLQIVDPLDGEVRERDVDTLVGQRCPPGVAADAHGAAADPAACPDTRRHRRREIDTEHLGAAIHTLEPVEGIAGAAAQIDDTLRGHPDAGEAIDELIGDLLLQIGGVIVVRRGAIECAADTGLVDRVRGLCFAQARSPLDG